MLKQLNQDTLLQGVQALAKIDADLAIIATKYGPPPLWERETGFRTLIHIILEQQVSLASAKAAYNKLVAATNPLTPENFLKHKDEKLKQFGFSWQKSRYGRELAKSIIDGSLNLEALNSLDDKQAKKKLMGVKGIGPWTADIYLIMALGRPDVFPKGDMALEIAIQRVKGLPTRPSSDETISMSKKWKPWRAVAARLLWHYYLSEPKKAST